MYTVIAAFGIEKKHGSRWMDLPSVLALPVEEIFSTYRKVYLTLTAGFLTEPVYFDLDFFRIKYPNFTGTLDDMFIDNGTENIDIVPAIPEIDTKYSQFSDAFRAGYKVSVTVEDNLKLYRKNTDPTDVYKHCLFTVNGMLHKSDTDGEFVYVLKGAISAKLSRRNQLGIWSFKNMSEIRSYSITDNMITKQHDTSKFSDRAYITIPEDPAGKSVLLSLGGYLVRPHPEVFYKVGDQTYCVVLSRLPILERFFESRDVLDYSSLDLDRTTANPNQINLEQFYSDEVMSKYITLTQSFVIVMDKDNIFFNEEYLNNSNLPGMFIGYTEPKYPLFAGHGKICEYWRTFEDGHYAINVADSSLQNKVFNTVNRKAYPSVSTNNVPSLTHYKSRAYMLELGCDF